MAGVKGRSGRQSNFDEGMRLRILRKAWAITEKALDDPDLDPMEKRELASKLVVKHIPTELSGGFTATVNHMPTIQRIFSPIGEAKPNSRLLDFDIGSPVTPEDTRHPGETPSGS